MAILNYKYKLYVNSKNSSNSIISIKNNSRYADGIRSPLP